MREGDEYQSERRKYQEISYFHLLAVRMRSKEWWMHEKSPKKVEP
jgi:hypothetical protein